MGKKKKERCKNCSVFRDGECFNEGPMLFTQMSFRYADLGYGKDEAGKKSFLRPRVEPNHTGCKHWRKKK